MSGLRALAAGLILCAACGQSNVMRDQRSLQPLEPPLHMVPASSEAVIDPEPAHTPAEAAALDNPKGPEGATEQGALGYKRFCGQCHGTLGRGWTPVGSSLDPGPGDLVASSARLSDGELFGVITFGKGASPPLGSAIAIEERWLIVNYTRSLGARRQGVEQAWGQ